APGKVWRIGFLDAFPSANNARLEAFRQKLRELGYVEGKTIVIDYVSAEGKYELLPARAADLVRRNSDVIVTTGGGPAAGAARDATRTIPIVFVAVGDPVAQGLVASLARPGGNLTGFSTQSHEVVGKLLALLKEIVPSPKRIAFLSNPANPVTPFQLKEMQTAARALRLEAKVVEARSPDEFDRAFTEIARDRPAGLVIQSDPMFVGEFARLAGRAAKYSLPTITLINSLPERGGLMSYGPSPLAMLPRAAIYVDKILKGDKPGDMPVQQPTEFELVINMKTARALGLTIPESVLFRADSVIR